MPAAQAAAAGQNAIRPWAASSPAVIAVRSSLTRVPAAISRRVTRAPKPWSGGSAVGSNGASAAAIRSGGASVRPGARPASAAARKRRIAGAASARPSRKRKK